jgi:hypothetical protein
VASSLGRALDLLAVTKGVKRISSTLDEVESLFLCGGGGRQAAQLLLPVAQIAGEGDVLICCLLVSP